ncbi:hypothetical protein [Thiorhodovibrio frisius]|uniref:Uncharacterized protein n=1 Tax=Thiorhodovibrio frisius TaxID=631362 RepID=H8Z7V5_9GAMM|nr:hypothetical protein [Thiorhodovibrio frisius]EIC20967.1 hypothetical protein Thi970DRAFT_04647 [Thiorhodovibrio frisius]WPL22024.1 hypothetical protein Thiofri_02173 [Thiorhodovibrio frisius]
MNELPGDSYLLQTLRQAMIQFFHLTEASRLSRRLIKNKEEKFHLNPLQVKAGPFTIADKMEAKQPNARDFAIRSAYKR